MQDTKFQFLSPFDSSKPINYFYTYFPNKAWFFCHIDDDKNDYSVFQDFMQILYTDFIKLTLLLFLMQPNPQSNATLIPFPAPINTQKSWHATPIDSSYDIKQSTILKMSNQPLNHSEIRPQILCLLQAAEIERLTEYLNEYRTRYRQASRQSLDRQSYEIQIRKLMQKEVNDQYDIDRLKQVVLKLTSKNDQQKRKVGEIEARYNRMTFEYREIQKVLESMKRDQQNTLVERDNIKRRAKTLQSQLFVAHSRHDNLKVTSSQEIQNLRQELLLAKNSIESLQRTQAELTAKVNLLPHYQQKISDYQLKMGILAQERDRTLQTNNQFQDRIARSEQQLKKQEWMTQELTFLHNSVKDQLLAVKDKSTKNEIENKKIVNQLKKVNEVLRQEVERTKREKEDFRRQIDKLRQIASFKQAVEAQNKQLKQNLSDLGNLKRMVATLEIQKKSDSQQNERLASLLTYQALTLKNSENEKERLKLASIERQQQWKNLISSQLNLYEKDYEKKSDNFKKQIKQLEEKIKFLVQDRRKVVELLKTQSQESLQIKNKFNEISKLRKDEKQVSDIFIRDMKGDRDKLRNETQELKNRLQAKIREADYLAAQNKNLSIHHTYVTTDYEKKIERLQKIINEKQSSIQNQALSMSKLKSQKKQIEDKLNIVLKERQQLNKMVGNKVVEAEALKRQMIKLQSQLRSNFDEAFKHTSQLHDQQKQKWIEQKEKLNKSQEQLLAKVVETNALQTKIRELNNHIKLLYSNLNDLGHSLNLEKKSRQELLTESLNIKRTNQENQLKMIQKYEKQLRDKSILYHSQLNQLFDEYQKLRRRLAGTEELDKKMAQYQNKIASLNEENKKLNFLLVSAQEKQRAQKDKINAQSKRIQKQSQKLKMQLVDTAKSLNEAKSLIAGLQKANKIQADQITQSKAQLSHLSSIYSNKTGQNERLKRKMMNIENQINQNYIATVNKLQKQLQQKTNSWKKEKALLEKQISEIPVHKQKVEQLNRQNLLLSGIIEKKQKQSEKKPLQSISTTVQSYKIQSNQLLNKIKDVESEFVSLQLIIKQMKNEQLQYRKKVSSLITAINKLEIQQQALSTHADSLLKFQNNHEKDVEQHLQRIHQIINDLGQIRTTESTTFFKTVKQI